MALIFVTGNENKLREARHILGMDIESSALDIDEIQAIEVEKVARDKAIRAYEILKRPLMVEDTGLYLKDFNNFPGALVKWMIKCLGRDEMARLFANRPVVAECCLCYYDGKETRIFKGQVSGHISEKPLGASGFGWDPIFIPEGQAKSFAQMSPEEKNSLSHRGKAFRAAKEFLNSLD